MCSPPIFSAMQVCAKYMKAVKVARLFVNDLEREPEMADFYGSKEGFSVWQQFLEPFYYQRSLKERVEVAIDLSALGNGPEVQRLSLAIGPLPLLAHAEIDRHGRTLLNAVARGLGSRLSRTMFELREMERTGMNIS